MDDVCISVNHPNGYSNVEVVKSYYSLKMSLMVDTE